MAWGTGLLDEKRRAGIWGREGGRGCARASGAPTGQGGTPGEAPAHSSPWDQQVL